MHIRNEQPNDIERISQIHYAAFKGHPMHKPGAEPVEHLIVEQLRASNALSLSLLVEMHQEAVGHIAFSPVTVGACTLGWFLLGPIGVVPELQGKGMGSVLIHEALFQMRNTGALGIVLVGDPEFYKRFGFKSMPNLSWSGVPNRFVLGLSFTEALPEGEIIAHNAFSTSGS